MLSTMCLAKQKSLQMCAELRHCQMGHERRAATSSTVTDQRRKTSLSVSRRSRSRHRQIAAWCQSILDFATAWDDESGSGDSQNCRTSSTQISTANIPTLSFHGPAALPVAQPTVSEQRRHELQLSAHYSLESGSWLAWVIMPPP